MAGEVDPPPAKAAKASRSDVSKPRGSRPERPKSEGSSSRGFKPKAALRGDAEDSGREASKLVPILAGQVQGVGEQRGLQPIDDKFTQRSYPSSSIRHGKQVQIPQQNPNTSPAEKSDPTEQSDNKIVLYGNLQPSGLRPKQSYTEKPNRENPKDQEFRRDGGKTGPSGQQKAIKDSNLEMQHKQNKPPLLESNEKERKRNELGDTKRLSGNHILQDEDKDWKLDSEYLSINPEEDAEDLQHQRRQQVRKRSNISEQSESRPRELQTSPQHKGAQETTSQEMNQQIRKQFQGPQDKKSGPKATEYDTRTIFEKPLDRAQELEKNTNKARIRISSEEVRSVQLRILGNTNANEQEVSEGELTERGLNNETEFSEPRKTHPARETNIFKSNDTDVETRLIAQLRVLQEEGYKKTAELETSKRDFQHNLVELERQTKTSEALKLEVSQLREKNVSEKRNLEKNFQAELQAHRDQEQRGKAAFSKIDKRVQDLKEQNKKLLVSETNLLEQLKKVEQQKERLENGSKATAKGLQEQVEKLKGELSEQKRQFLIKDSQLVEERTAHEVRMGEQRRKLETQNGVTETQIKDLQGELRRLREGSTATTQQLQNQLQEAREKLQLEELKSQSTESNTTERLQDIQRLQDALRRLKKEGNTANQQLQDQLEEMREKRRLEKIESQSMKVDTAKQLQEIQDLQEELRRLRKGSNTTVQQLQNQLDDVRKELQLETLESQSMRVGTIKHLQDIQMLQAQKKQLEATEVALGLQVSESVRQQDNLRSRENNLKVEVKGLKQNLDERDTRVLRLNEENKELSQELKGLQSAKTTMESQIEKRDTKELELNKKIDELRQELKGLQSAKTTMESQIEKRDTKELELNKKIDELRQELKGLQSAKTTIESQIEKRDTKELELNKKIDELRQELNGLQSVKNSTDTQIRELQRQTDELKVDKNKIANEVQKLRIWETTAGKLEKQVKDLQEQLCRHNDLKKQHEGMGKDIIAWEEKNKKLDGQVQLLNEEKLEWEAEEVKLDRQIENLESEKSMLEKQIQEISLEQAQATAQSNISSDERNQWAVSKNALNSQIRALQGEKNKLVEENIKLERDFKVLQSQSNQLTAVKAGLDKDLKSLELQKEKWAAEKNEMDNELSELSKRQEIALLGQANKWSSDNAALTAKIETLESEKAGVVLQLEQSKEQKSAFSRQEDKWSSDKATLSAKIKTLESEKAGLVLQLEQSKEQKSAFSRQEDKWSSDKATLSAKIKTLESEKAGLVLQFEQSKEGKSALSKQGDEWSSSKAVLTARIKTLELEKIEMGNMSQSFKEAHRQQQLERNKKIETLERELESIPRLKLANSALKTQADELHDQKYQLELENAQLNKTAKDLHRQQAEEVTKANGLERQIQDLHRQILERNTKIDILERQLKGLAQLELQNTTLDTQVQRLNTQVQKLHLQLDQLKSEKAQLNKTAQDLQQQKLERSTKIDALERQLKGLAQLELQNTTLDAQVQRLNTQVQKLYLQLDQLKSEKAQLNKTAQDLQQQKLERSTKIDALERQLKGLAQLELQNTTLDTQVQRLNTQAQKLQHQLDQLESEKAQLNKTVQDLQRQKLVMERQLMGLSKLELETTTLRGQVQTSNTEVQRLNTQLKELQRQMDQLESEKTQLKKRAEEFRLLHRTQEVQWTAKVESQLEDHKQQKLQWARNEEELKQEIHRNREIMQKRGGDAITYTADLSAQLEKLQRQKAAWSTTQQVLIDEAASVVREKDKVEALLTDLQDQHRRCDKNARSVEQTAEVFRQQVAKEKNALVQQLEQLQEQHDKCAEEERENLQELERLRSLQSEQKERMRVQLQDLRNLNEKYDEARQKASNFQRQIESLNDNHARENKSRELEENSRRSRFLETIESLEKDLKSKKDELESLARKWEANTRRSFEVPCPHKFNHWVEEKAAFQDSLKKLQDQRDRCVEELADCQKLSREQAQEHLKAAHNSKQMIEEQEAQWTRRLRAELDEADNTLRNSQAEVQVLQDQLGKAQQSTNRHGHSELKLQELRLELEEASLKLQQNESALQDHISKLEIQGEELVKLHGESSSLRIEVATYKAEIRSMRRDCARGTSLETQLQHKIESDTMKIRELRETIGAQKERIRRFQEDFFRMEKKTVRESIEEKTLANYIRKEVVEPTNDWSYKFARKDGDLSDFERSSPDVWRQLMQQSQDFHETASGASRQYEPQILLNYLLAHYITENVIKRPFLQLNDRGEVMFSQKMENLYDDFRGIDEAEAYAWRLQTLNFIMLAQARDRPQFWGNDIAWMKTQVKKFQPSHCSKLASNFIKGPAQMLIARRSLGRQLHQELVDVIQAAGWYGSAFWRQFESLKILEFEDLKEKKFSCKSAEMEWDRAHRLDPGDNRLDGHGIVMVVQPGFVGISTEDGEMKPQENVLSKAVVF